MHCFFLISLALLTSCIVHRPRRIVMVKSEPRPKTALIKPHSKVIVVRKAPPPPRVVRVRPPRPAGKGVWVWIPGRWKWTGHTYVWVKGHWVKAPGGKRIWVPGRWVRQGNGWIWIEGHWK